MNMAVQKCVYNKNYFTKYSLILICSSFIFKQILYTLNLNRVFLQYSVYSISTYVKVRIWKSSNSTFYPHPLTTYPAIHLIWSLPSQSQTNNTITSIIKITIKTNCIEPIILFLISLFISRFKVLGCMSTTLKSTIIVESHY